MNGMDRAYQMTGTRRHREHAMGLSRFHPVLTQIAGPLAHRDDIASQVDILNTIPREDQLIAHLSIRQAHDHMIHGGMEIPHGHEGCQLCLGVLSPSNHTPPYSAIRIASANLSAMPCTAATVGIERKNACPPWGWFSVTSNSMRAAYSSGRRCPVPGPP